MHSHTLCPLHQGAHQVVLGVPVVRILDLALLDVRLHVLVALDGLGAARASRYGLVVLPLVHLELVRVREGLVGVGPVAAAYYRRTPT